MGVIEKNIRAQESKLEIKSIINDDGIVVFSFNGELSAFNTDSARDALSKILSNHKFNIVFDFSQLAYIDSFAIGFVVSALRDVIGRGGDLKLAALSPFCERVMKKVLNLDFFIKIFDSVDEARFDFKANAASAAYRWQTVLAKQPNYPDAYLNLALIFLRNGLLAEAFTEVKKALELNNYYIDALNVCGQILLKMGENEDAIKNFKKVLDLAPDNLEALTWLAICYDDFNMLDEAITRYKNAIEIYPKYADLYYRLGMTYLKKQNHDLAIESLKKALEINPNYLDVHRVLSTIYLKSREKEMAINHLTQICEISIDAKELSDTRELLGKVAKGNFPSSYFLDKIF